MKLYRDTLRTAWHHAIQRPGLWIFGFFATLVFGASGELDRYLRFMNSIVTDGHLLNAKSWLDGRWASVAVQLVSQLTAGNVSTWVLVVGSVLGGLLVVFMMCISVGALIHSAKHKTESFTIAFGAGLKHWVQLVVLFTSAYVLVAAVTLAMVTIVLALFPDKSFENAQLAVVLVAGIVFVPLVIVASFLVRLAAMSIVLDGNHVGKALQHAWKLFARHWLVVLEMAIASFIVVGIANVIIVFGLLFIFLPYIVAISASGSDVALIRLSNTLFYGQWLYLAFSLFTASILSTWQWSAWTALFETLRTTQPTSTLVGLIRSDKQ